MGNRKARELMLKDEQAAQWERIRTEPRHLTSDVYIRGIGIRRIQLIVYPSFEPVFVWDVREGPEGWRLFRPRALEPESGLVTGYDEIPFATDRLSSFFEKVTGITLPIAPDLSSTGGADGTEYELSVTGDLGTSWRFRWWSQAPNHWRPLVEITNEMIVAFSKAEGANPPEIAKVSTWCQEGTSLNSGETNVSALKD
jgi:hypothetical protein